MSVLKTLAAFLCAAVLSLSPHMAAADSVETGEAQLARFVSLFPGRYDSAQQVLTDQLNGVPEDYRNYQRHSIFRQVDLPALGDTVFLAHQYRDGDPANVYRQRLYTFTAKEGGFRLRVHVPKDKDALKGAYQNIAQLQGLGPDDFTVWEGCDLFWSWNGEAFVGSLTPGACRFQSKAFGQEIILEETLTLTKESLSFADRGVSETEEWLFGMRGNVPNISLKARPFLCQSETETLWLHDQGGSAELGDYTLRLQRLNIEEALRPKGFPTGLRLSASQDGARDLSVLGGVDSETISIDLGTETLRCRYAPETIYSEGN